MCAVKLINLDELVLKLVEKMILEGIRALRGMLEHIGALLEGRLIGVDEPLPDEVRAVEEYEAEKKSGKLELMRLEDVIREAGNE